MRHFVPSAALALHLYWYWCCCLCVAQSFSFSSSPSSVFSSLPAAASSIPEVLKGFHPFEKEVLGELLARPNVTVERRVPGASLLGFRMTREEGGASAFSITDSWSHVSLHLPATLLDVLGVDSLLGTMWSVEEHVLRSAVEPDETGRQVIAQICVDLHLLSEDGVLLNVSDLEDAITLAMPVSDSSASCAWWDRAASRWSFEGLVKVEDETGGQSKNNEGMPMLTCNTTHLTFFGAILEGFLKALDCAQLQLLSVEALQELAEGQWRTAPVAVLYCCLLAFLALLLAIACVLDSDRASAQGDEHFLVARYDVDDSEMQQLEQVISDPVVVPLQTRAQETCCFCFSSAWRDILDEFLSRWFAFSGELRSFFEVLCGHAAELPEGGQDDAQGAQGAQGQRAQGVVGKAVHCMMISLLRAYARRQACAALHVSMSTVSFVTEDKQLGKLLLKAAKERDLGNSSGVGKRLQDWRLLHAAVIRHIDARWSDPLTWRWCSLPRHAVKIFCTSNPLVTMLYRCHFHSRSQRVMLFTCELLGAITLCCIFFEASGSTTKKSRTDCKSTGGLYELGRLLAIAVASLLVAGIPVCMLSALNHRTFCEFDYEGCEAWRRKLRAWRLQGKLFWVFSSLYAGASGLFIFVFLANVGLADHESLGTTAAIQVLEECLAAPLGLAAIVPSFTGGALSLARRLRGCSKAELLAASRLEVAQRGNWRDVEVEVESTPPAPPPASESQQQKHQVLQMRI